MSSKIKVKVEGEQNGADCRDLCRLCLAKCSDGELIDIFDYNTETSISLRIMACAGFEVSDFQTNSDICLYFIANNKTL